MDKPFTLIVLIGLTIIAIWPSMLNAQAEQTKNSSATKADSGSTEVTDDFLQSIADHLSVVREQMIDTAFPLARREAIASETLGMLRGKVGESPNTEDALKVWSILIDLAELFGKKHPGHPMSDRFKLTIAEAWWQRSRLLTKIEVARNPSSTVDAGKMDREKARQLFEKMVVSNGPANDQYSQSARYLLAQCLADEISALPKIDPVKAAPEREKILELTKNLDSDSLLDWSYLIRARTMADLGRSEAARTELEKTSESFRHRNGAAWADVKVAVLAKCNRWDEADHFLKSTDLPISLSARLRVALWADRATKPLNAEELKTVQTAVFESMEKLKDKDDFDAVQARRILSLSKIQPKDDAKSSDWSNLAESYVRNGQPELSAMAYDKAAARAVAEMNPVLKMKYQFQSGAAWFKAGKPNQAQQRMNQVVESSDPGELGPKASLIRVMSLKSMGLSGRDTLSEAIRTHLSRFSDDKMTTGEVRWIEGDSDLSVGGREDAIIAWEAIAPAHPRWMAAQLAMSNIGLERLEELVLISDVKEFAIQWEKTRRRLERARDSAPTLQDKNTLELAIARIDMTPGSDRIEAARQTCLRLMPVLTRDSQRQWANAILIMTDALLSRSLDLETRLSQRDKSMDSSLILDMCRVMDTSAQMIDTEITRRQLGSAMARLAESLPVSGPELNTAADKELELRRIRGLIYAGQPSSAEPRLDLWIKANPNVKPTLLYAVADALLRLNATSKAIRYLSEWVDHEPEGTTQWFLGRLELAKALYREGRDKESAKLIDATLLLYPDAGGPGLKKRYDKFRRSLNK